MDADTALEKTCARRARAIGLGARLVDDFFREDGAVALLPRTVAMGWARTYWHMEAGELGREKEIWIEVDEDQQKAYIGLPLDGRNNLQLSRSRRLLRWLE